MAACLARNCHRLNSLHYLWEVWADQSTSLSIDFQRHRSAPKSWTSSPPQAICLTTQPREEGALGKGYSILLLCARILTH
eukprot:3174268-Amphidinium_carterae.1